MLESQKSQLGVLSYVLEFLFFIRYHNMMLGRRTFVQLTGKGIFVILLLTFKSFVIIVKLIVFV